jgi:hypothetical protein
VIAPTEASEPLAGRVQPERRSSVAHGSECTWVIGGSVAKSGVERDADSVAEKAEKPCENRAFQTPRLGLEPRTYRLTVLKSMPHALVWHGLVRWGTRVRRG